MPERLAGVYWDDDERPYCVSLISHRVYPLLLLALDHRESRAIESDRIIRGLHHMVRKSPSIIRASLCLLMSVMLLQCQNARRTPTLEPIGALEQPATRGSDAEIVAFLSDYLDRLAGRRNFSGVVLFARDESVLFHRAYGLASRSYNARNTTDTRFNLASASKMFTAVAIAKLVEDGRLSYDDPIGTYLDTDWVSQEVGATVQVKHLLNHTSGLGHYWDKWDDYANTIRELDDYKPIISDELAFEPGTDYQYSNSGYLLLGAMIEKITGKTYYQYTFNLHVYLLVQYSIFICFNLEPLNLEPWF